MLASGPLFARGGGQAVFSGAAAASVLGLVLALALALARSAPRTAAP